METTG
jgi:hypothetical protein